MKNNNIHPTAIVEDGAVLGNNITLEPYAVIKKHVTLEDGVCIKSHVYLDGYTTIGEGTTIYPFACIGTKTQDLKYKGEKTFVKIGKRCEIRECVTINSSCQEGSTVKIGDECLIMAYCHIAHNCEVGNRVIMSNNATLAGHVIVEDHVIIAGMTPVHQFSRIGAHAFVGGMSRVTHDVPPYTIGAGIPYKFGGLNLVGLKRKGFTLETRVALSKAFKILYRSGLSVEAALEKIEAEVDLCPEVRHFVDFCKATKRGLIGLQNCVKNDEDMEHFEEEKPLSSAGGCKRG